jgi:hypothetical protein
MFREIVKLLIDICNPVCPEKIIQEEHNTQLQNEDKESSVIKITPGNKIQVTKNTPSDKIEVVKITPESKVTVQSKNKLVHDIKFNNNPKPTITHKQCTKRVRKEVSSRPKKEDSRRSFRNEPVPITGCFRRRKLRWRGRRIH